MANSKIVYLLFDSRFRTDEDSSMCYEFCDSLTEAKENCRDYGSDTVIVQASVVGKEIKYLKIVN